MRFHFVLMLLLTSITVARAATPASTAPITINTNFEGGSLGKIQKISDTHFICAVKGEYNEEGRNRQASWYFFRLDNVRDRDLTIELVDLVGEYNGRYGACPLSAATRPVFSYDGRAWQHFGALEWNDTSKTATLRFRPAHDRLWIAHIPPYTTRDLERLLDAARQSPHARVEVYGRTPGGRDLVLVTVTNFAAPDAGKKVVWLMARQHAWEAGGSHVADGALRFVLSDDPEARRLRDRVLFVFTPMLDPDGVARGGVRFNANGYDVNRHWNEVDLRDPRALERMPEIWYTKKTIVHFARAERPIDLLLYLHNEESGEWINNGPPEDDAFRAKVRRLFDLLVKETSFDPSRPPVDRWDATHAGATEALYHAARVPAIIMEQRVNKGAKLGRCPTVADRLAFGAGLIRCMARAVLVE